MNVKVVIPTPLRQHTAGEKSVLAAGETVGSVLRDLVAKHENLASQLLDADGGIRSHVNVFLNTKNMRDQDGLETLVSEGDEVVLVTAMAGG